MGKKRKSGGRSKGKKGSGGFVSCSQCGKRVPRDKAKRRTSYSNIVDPMIARELRQSGTQIQRSARIRFYCVNCAIHRHVVNIRAKDERKTKVRTSRF